MKRISTLVVATILTLTNLVAIGQSGKISIQGILKNFDGTVVTDGSYDMEFNIYTQPTGGTPIWTETQSGADAVQTNGGVYNTLLGKTTAGSTALTALPFNVPYYVGITVISGSNPLEMTPRIELAYAVNSFHAAEANHATNSDTATVATMAYGVTFTGSGISEIGGDLTLSANPGNVVIGGSGVLVADTVRAFVDNQQYDFTNGSRINTGIKDNTGRYLWRYYVTGLWSGFTVPFTITISNAIPAGAEFFRLYGSGGNNGSTRSYSIPYSDGSNGIGSWYNWSTGNIIVTGNVGDIYCNLIIEYWK